MPQFRSPTSLDVVNILVDVKYLHDFKYPAKYDDLQVSGIVRSSAYSAYNFRHETDLGVGFESLRVPRSILRHISSLKATEVSEALEWLNTKSIFVETELQPFGKNKHVLHQSLPDFEPFTSETVNSANKDCLLEAFEVSRQLKQDLGIVLQLSPYEFFDNKEPLNTPELIVAKTGVRIVGTGLYRADGSFLERRIGTSNKRFEQTVNERLIQIN
jgi:hypothetical protein